MVKHLETRRAMHNAINRADFKREKINWEMTTIRHAIFKVIDKCSLIQKTSWSFDVKNQLTICNLMFKTKLVKITYDYKSRQCVVTDEVVTKNCLVEELPDVVYSMQPKVKIVIKKKAV